MASVLICSQNHFLLDKCSKALVEEHQIKQATELKPGCEADVIIVDTALVDQDNGLLELIQDNTAHFLLTGSHWPEEKQVEAMLHSASGYYDQNDPELLLQKAVRSILLGDIWINRHLVPKVIHTLIGTKVSKTGPQNHSSSAELIKTLSCREMDVAKLISQGESNKQIASTLHISERTVKAHLTSIFKKLNVSDRLHLAILLKETD